MSSGGPLGTAPVRVGATAARGPAHVGVRAFVAPVALAIVVLAADLSAGGRGGSPRLLGSGCGRRWAEVAVDVRLVTKGLPRSGAAVGRPVWGDVAGETPHVHVLLQFVPAQSGVVGGCLAEQPIVPQAV